MLLYKALILLVYVDPFAFCEASLIPRDQGSKIKPLTSNPSTAVNAAQTTSLNTTALGTVFDYNVLGTNTRIRFTSLSDGFLIVSPDAYMCLALGLYTMTKSIAARGPDALANNNELAMEYESADLWMKHSETSPGAMQLRVFSNLLYGIVDVIYAHGLHVEVKLDVWDKRMHVGTGWLLNKDRHPQAKVERRNLQ